MKDQLACFSDLYAEVQYKLATTGKNDGNCFVHNPEMIMKI